MATVYRTPGVFVEEIAKFPPSVAQVETAIPAFIGYTQKHNKDNVEIPRVPVKIGSLLEFQEFFGGPQPEINVTAIIDQATDPAGRVLKEIVTADFNWPAGGPSRHVMFYALQQYFANGGGPCYIVSVGQYLPTFGEELNLSVDYITSLDTLRKVDEPTLLVFPEGQGMGLGNYVSVFEAALQQCVDLQDRFTIIDVHDGGRTVTNLSGLTTIRDDFRSAINAGPGNLRYGAAYFPNVRSTFDYEVNHDLVQVTRSLNGVVQAVELFPALNNADRSKVSGAIRNMGIHLPPSATVAGVYARVDNTRGVWKAPANEGLTSVNDITYRMTDREQETFNIDVNAGRSINVIRAFPGRGIKIWGGRTLDGNDNEWRYISVRRFFNMVEESVKKATEAFVFEPNDRNTWVRVRGMIENFLILQWRAGALQGAVPEHAFYVKVGLPETMTPLDILEGRMIVEIGMAVVRPAEFIILRFSHKMAES